MLYGLISILVLILVTGFFVASEFAIVTVRKTRLEQLVTEGRVAAKDVKYAVEHLELYIAAVQIGITMAALGLGALGEPVLAEFILPVFQPLTSSFEAWISAHSIAVTVSFLLVTVIEITLGEIVPKMIARQRTVGVALFIIRPLNVFVFIFRPLIWIVNFLSDTVLHLFGMHKADEQASVYSVEELELIVASSREAGVLDRTEEVILRRVFDFGDLTARQVMRPRTELAALPVDAPLEEALQLMADEKHSRFPVYEGDLDHIVGVLHVRDLLPVLAHAAQAESSGSPDGLNPNANIRSLMRPISAVPETLDVGEVLKKMQLSNVQMVVVIDEYGGTSGIVTLEDIVEEIVGELRDEFEPVGAPTGIVPTPEGTLVDGLVPIDDVNDVLDLDIESEADTIGGYVFEVLGRKPELGDEISYDGYKIRVEELDGLRIQKVRFTPTAKHRASNPEGGEE